MKFGKEFWSKLVIATLMIVAWILIIVMIIVQKLYNPLYGEMIYSITSYVY